MNLEGKKVLFIATKFFGYEVEIQKELERRGAHVNFIADRPFERPWQNALNKIAPSLLQPYVEKLFHRELIKFKTESYDLIFVVRGQTLSVNMHRKLKKLYPTAVKILYMWDSMENSPSVRKTLIFYDKKYSFDPISSEKYNMNFRPLFFINKFKNVDSFKAVYDISFIGTMHSDRYLFIKKIQNAFDNKNFYWYFYLQAKWVFYLYKIIKPAMHFAKISEFKFSSISKEEVKKIFTLSKCILDIEHPGQNGLTMRTFEAMGSNKKIITTNKSILSYDFYDSNNVLVVDRHEPKISEVFLKNDFKPLADNIFYKYTLAGWLDDILI